MSHKFLIIPLAVIASSLAFAPAHADSKHFTQDNWADGLIKVKKGDDDGRRWDRRRDDDDDDRFGRGGRDYDDSDRYPRGQGYSYEDRRYQRSGRDFDDSRYPRGGRDFDDRNRYMRGGQDFDDSYRYPRGGRDHDYDDRGYQAPAGPDPRLLQRSDQMNFKERKNFELRQRREEAMRESMQAPPQPQFDQ